MSVYIKGMEMPSIDLEWRIIRGQDGKWYAIDVNAETSDGEWHEIVPVPEHGDLIDLKSPFEAQYYDDMTEEWIEKAVTVEDVLCGCMVSDMPPVIIEAEDGDT